MIAIYHSPLRPLDIGYASRLGSIAIDWEHTDIGEWTPHARYAFAEPLPDALVDQMTLVRVEEPL